MQDERRVALEVGRPRRAVAAGLSMAGRQRLSVSHVERVPPSPGGRHAGYVFWSIPSMYQGNSAGFIGPRDPIEVPDRGLGLDFEAEIAVITGDVPRGVTPGGGRGAHCAS